MQVPKSIAENTVYDPAIDGLRGLATLMVILDHTTLCALQDSTNPFHYSWIATLGRGGAAGVSLFFILSSFTLMLSTSTRYYRENTPRLNFYIRRAFRILPLWWIFIPVSAFVRNSPKELIVPHLFMYFGFLKGANFTHVGWSLFVEETFYVFFPLIFIFLLRLKGALTFFVICLLLSARIPGVNLESMSPTWLKFIFELPLRHYATFSLGILCFHLIKSDDLSVQKLKIPIHLWDFFAIPLFIASFFFTENHGNFNIFSFFILVLAALQDGTWIRRFLHAKLLRTFGVCCYSIYLFHGLFLFWFRHTLFFRSLGAAPLFPECQMIIGFIIAAAVSYFVGGLSFRYFEQPCVQVGKWIVNKLQSVSDQTRKSREQVVEPT